MGKPNRAREAIGGEGSADLAETSNADIGDVSVQDNGAEPRLYEQPQSKAHL
jgi:hypothetical protein